MTLFVKDVKIPKGAANSFLHGLGVFLIVFACLAFILEISQPSSSGRRVTQDDEFVLAITKEIKEQQQIYQYSIIISLFLSGVVFIGMAEIFKVLRANTVINQISNYEKTAEVENAI